MEFFYTFCFCYSAVLRLPACERGLDANASSGSTIDELHFRGHIILS